MAAVDASGSLSSPTAPSRSTANGTASVSPSKSPSTARQSSLAREFARHVALDDGVLATSAPLDLKKIDRVLLLTAEALAPLPDTRQRAQEIRDRLMTQRLIGVAEALSSTLELLSPIAAADEFFKRSILQALRGDSLPLQAPALDLVPAAAATAAAASSPKPQAKPKPTPRRLSESPKAERQSNLSPARPRRHSRDMSTPPRSAAKQLRLSSPSPSRSVPAPQSVSAGETAPSVVSEASSRKRSMDATSSSSSSSAAAGEQPRPSKKGKRRASSSSEAPTRDTQSVDPLSLHPIDSVPTPWEPLHYKDVPVINIQSPGATAQIQALRFAGTPFILEGHEGYTRFADDWVLPNGALDTEAFLRGLHDVKVPVLEKNYEDTNPIKTHLPLGYYVRNYWEKGKADYYMHQWQFPLTPKANKALCYKCTELPVLGDNLLLYWLDAVRGDNPLQYFFMGQRSTTSRMHQDPGGLDITIAPIVGTKRVTMLHRAAAKLDSVHAHVNFHDVDLNAIPLLAFMPAWRVDVSPGQILYMPEGTFHACENITACLSYHRFHVDNVNMPGFLASFMAQDGPGINHAEILWNATHDVMASLEEHYYASGQRLDVKDVGVMRKLDSLRALRHASRVLSLEDAVPTEDSWDWTKLLEDIDHLLVRIDPKAVGRQQRVKKESPASNTIDLTDQDAADVKPAVKAGPPAAKKSDSEAQTHWEALSLKVGDTIGVQVFEKRNKAKVLKIALNMELVQVHYVDWGSIYDEFLPVSSLYQRSTRTSKRVAYRKAPKVHEPVLAKWGSNGQLYNAIVLKVIRSNACLVHYLKFEKDWDQWILPGHIFKKYPPSSE
ncbi:hypothetical protein P43SY_008237 [Pythium insidiosum]|uniref:JmjC domain-containing protein n=1 Tax=Pythium insidiosum TaxID=114742 RepID=A0AAD5M440_PYTIN|nr:hypothetical protein P43SY_008237 [Pythium insidiosum]